MDFWIFQGVFGVFSGCFQVFSGSFRIFQGVFRAFLPMMPFPGVPFGPFQSTKTNFLGPEGDCRVGWGSSMRRGGGQKGRAHRRKLVFLGFGREEPGSYSCALWKTREPWSSFPCFFGFPCLFCCKEFPCFFGRLPFLPMDFRGSAQRKVLAFWVVFSKGKEDQGNEPSTQEKLARKKWTPIMFWGFLQWGLLATLASLTSRIQESPRQTKPKKGRQNEKFRISRPFLCEFWCVFSLGKTSTIHTKSSWISPIFVWILGLFLH